MAEFSEEEVGRLQAGLAPYASKRHHDLKARGRKFVVRGVPQVIHKIQLRNVPEQAVFGLDPAALVHFVLVGPTQYPMTLSETFHKAMLSAGIEDPARRLKFSTIPLRR